MDAVKDGRQGANENGSFGFAHADDDSWFVILQVASLWLGLPAHLVEAILEAAKPTPIPRAPAHVPGLIARQGRALPLLDLYQFWGLSEDSRKRQENRSQRIAVVEADGMNVGLICDQVAGVKSLPEETVRKPEVTSGQRVGEFCSGEVDDGGRLVALIDLPKLLDAAKVRA